MFTKSFPLIDLLPNLVSKLNFRALHPKICFRNFLPKSHFRISINLRLIVEINQNMVDCTVFAVNFRGECKLISINGSSKSFQGLMSQVRNKWVDLVNFTMLASFGSFINCCLESDDDLINIAFLFNQSSARFVSVELQNIILNDCTDLAVSLNNAVIPCSTIDYNGEQQEFGPLSCIPCYDVSPSIIKKTYLSDSWSDLMSQGVGSVFTGGSVGFREALIKYSTQKGFQFKFNRNTKEYIYVVCNESLNSQCDWFIRAKLQRNSGYFVIHKANLDHKCIGKLLKSKTKRLNPRIMGDLISHDVKNNSSLSGSDALQFFSNSYGFDIPYYKAWRSVEAAKDNIYGSYDDSYDELRWYCKAVERTNPGSVVTLEHNKLTQQFERLFLAFKACIDGFRSCRPLLFIDGTFLRGRAKGTLLTATAKDGNNGLFPVALGLVSAENTANWEWFLRSLRDYVKHEEPIIYISDRNTGLLSALNNVFEKPLHFYCLYHLLQNLKGKFSSGWTNNQRADLGDLFKACAYAPNERLFNECVVRFKNVGGKLAEDWLDTLPLDKWTFAHAPDMKRYGEMTSNAAESFNNWIRKSRSMPVMRMLDSIRQKVSRWFVKRKKASENWNTALVPKYQDQWDVLQYDGKSWCVDECTGGNFYVKSELSCTVDLDKRTCSCYKWQVSGFPCCHAIAVITRHDGYIYTYVSECFHAKNYRKSYSGDIQPIPETMKFEFGYLQDHETKIRPPALNRQPGRPKCSRNPSYGEFPKKKLKTCKA